MALVRQCPLNTQKPLTLAPSRNTRSYDSLLHPISTAMAPLQRLHQEAVEALKCEKSALTSDVTGDQGI